MRHLLLFSRTPLLPALVAALEASHWAVHRADDAAAARRLSARHDCMVGLVLFPEDEDLTTETCLREQVQELPELRWVAALSEAQLDHTPIKRFIAEQAYDFHVLPLQPERLTTVLGHAYGMARLTREFDRKGPPETHDQYGLIGTSGPMQTLYRLLQRAAESDVPVLITGATGTGKELCARAIHEHSERAARPFVALNCAAIPPSLLQAELFGYEKGAFTSANARKDGYIRSAAGGTLFLDEIGDMPLESQATLLRFLEDKIVTPIGSVRGQEVDVRVIASTNVQLERAVAARRFRADLYYRLAFLVVETPDLRTRGADIERLAERFLRQAADEARRGALRLTRAARERLRAHHWPGNVRELRNVVYQAALHSDGPVIDAGALRLLAAPPAAEGPSAAAPAAGAPGPAPESRDAPRQTPADAPTAPPETLAQARAHSEKAKLERALARNGANVSRTARELGVSRMTLYRLMAKHGVAREGTG